MVSSQRATGRAGLVVSGGSDVSARDGVTEKIVLVEHEHGVSTPETAGDNLGNQATSVLFDKTLIIPWLSEKTGIGLSGCAIVTGHGDERLLIVENVKVEGASERSGRDDFRGKH